MSSKYQKRHYEDVAHILREVYKAEEGELDSRGIPHTQHVIEGLVWEFDALFTEDNSLYDSKRFLKACGLE